MLYNALRRLYPVVRRTGSIFGVALLFPITLSHSAHAGNHSEIATKCERTINELRSPSVRKVLSVVLENLKNPLPGPYPLDLQDHYLAVDDWMRLRAEELFDDLLASDAGTDYVPKEFRTVYNLLLTTWREKIREALSTKKANTHASRAFAFDLLVRNLSALHSVTREKYPNYTIDEGAPGDGLARFNVLTVAIAYLGQKKEAIASFDRPSSIPRIFLPLPIKGRSIFPEIRPSRAWLHWESNAYRLSLEQNYEELNLLASGSLLFFGAVSDGISIFDGKEEAGIFNHDLTHFMVRQILEDHYKNPKQGILRLLKSIEVTAELNGIENPRVRNAAHAIYYKAWHEMGMDVLEFAAIERAVAVHLNERYEGFKKFSLKEGRTIEEIPTFAEFKTAVREVQKALIRIENRDNPLLLKPLTDLLYALFGHP